MKFRVPQFIDVEDKLFGPLTFKQFLYLVGAGALAFVIWSFIPFKFLAVMLAGPVIGFGVALAFVRINNRPFINILEAGFIYFTKNKLYIWKKVPKKKEPAKTQDEESIASNTSFVPRLSESKLKELSWGLDVYDNNNRN
ncbi:MAG: hypothetical protein RI996_166 [Candidatus Parcubacteria bacterium]|jgi:hypothetical protein